jgi:hypothetical protein
MIEGHLAVESLAILQEKLSLERANRVDTDARLLAAPKSKVSREQIRMGKIIERSFAR